MPGKEAKLRRGVDTRRCASKDVVSRMRVSYQMEKGTSVNEDVGP